MRGKDRRCVSQSYRFCGSCLCFSSISGVVYRPYTSAVIFSSHFSSLFGTTQQVSVFCCLIQYYTLVYLKYFMTVQIRNHYVPLIFSSETILIITRRKMNVLCPTLRKLCASAWYLFLRQKSRSFTSNWKKSTTSKITTMEFITSPEAAFFFCLHLDHVKITFACFHCLCWMKRLWQPNIRETNFKDLIGYVKNRKGDL